MKKKEQFLKEKDENGHYQWVNKSLDADLLEKVKKSIANYLGLNDNN